MYCKLTNQNMQTYNGFQWKLEEWYVISEAKRGANLCSKSWFHCYDDPLLAVLFNQVHADIKNPRLFECEARGESLEGIGVKFGFTEMRITKNIPLPEISTNQHVAFGILCAKEVCKVQSWNEWADNWLNGYDRGVKLANDTQDTAWGIGGRDWFIPWSACRAAAMSEMCPHRGDGRAAVTAHRAAEIVALNLKSIAIQAMEY